MFPAWALAEGPAAFAARVGDPKTRDRLVAEMLTIFPQQAGADRRPVVVHRPAP